MTHRFRDDGGFVEGIVCRIDNEEGMIHRCKLVRNDFTAGITSHWAKSKIEKQQIDADFALDYMKTCYQYSEDCSTVPTELSNPRQRAEVSYSETGGATCSMLPMLGQKDPSADDQSSPSVILPRNL